MRSDGLVLRVGTPNADSAKSLKLAKKAVQRELPGQWIVQPMGNESRDFTVRRKKQTLNPTVSQAFELAHRLRTHRDVEDCEPSLMMPTIGPEEMRPTQPRRIGNLSSVRRATRRSSSSSDSSGDGTHLACTAETLWAHSLSSVQQAWSVPLPTGGKSQGEGIIVGHPDTGFTSHPEIADPARYLRSRGYDFEDDDRDARDPLSGLSAGHGTATGSVIMSGDSAESGVTGIAPRCSLIPLRVTDNVVLLSFGKLASAIRFAADSRVHVISISLGGPVSSRFLHRAVQYAIERGVIVVSAAGNVWPFVVYPARLDEVIAVAACNCRKQIWTDSASGADVDITAPGESVWRALAEPNRFSVARSSGTSYSTAIVAGSAALWLAHHGRDRLVARYGAANLATVYKELLLSKGFDRPTGWDTSRYGAGILNARKLLAATLPVTAMARGLHGLRASAAPRSRNQIDELAELFPRESPGTVRAGLARLLRVNERDLNAHLRDTADEIAYHAVTNMKFRNRICGRAGLVTPRSRRSAGPAALRASTAEQTASMPTLSKQLKALTGVIE